MGALCTINYRLYPSKEINSIALDPRLASPVTERLHPVFLQNMRLVRARPIRGRMTPTLLHFADLPCLVPDLPPPKSFRGKEATLDQGSTEESPPPWFLLLLCFFFFLGGF